MMDAAMLAGEWLGRLADPARPAPMSAQTRRRLAEANEDDAGRRILIAGLISPSLGTARLSGLAEPGAFDRFLDAWRVDAGWAPDRDVLRAADRDLETIDASFAMRALVAWVAGDLGRCAICLTAAASSVRPSDEADRALATVVAFALTHGLAAGHGETAPYPVPSWTWGRMGA